LVGNMAEGEQEWVAIAAVFRAHADNFLAG
jgi:hypothetical protein